MAITPQERIAVAHPLEPLTPEEISTAVGILKAERTLGEQVRFATVVLNEPPKDVVLGFRPGTSWQREAFIVVLDNADGKTYEAVVSLSIGTVTSWEHIPGVQPHIMLDEFFECESMVKQNPEWQAAMRRRGIEDFDLAMVDPWSAGNYGNEPENERGLRLTRALTWIRANPEDNGYAHPVEGLLTLVDLNAMRVVKVEDVDFVKPPTRDHNYSPQAAGVRSGLKPIEIRQPEGPSFEVDGHEVRWQKWRFRIGFTPREGLVLYTVSYDDNGVERPILYRASVSDMVVPYGDPRDAYARRNAFDVGEYGIGTLSNALELGCDCLGEIRYFNAHMTNTKGEVWELPNVVCMHEEDFGILWKHYDWRTNYTEVRRSRRLVVSFIATVGNYEYGFYWYFYQDGNIQLEVKLTGVISNGAVDPSKPKPKWGELVAPGIYGPIHQHFFNVRLDMMVDGLNNSVYEINTVRDESGPENPYKNAFHTEPLLLATEQQAQREADPLHGRYWKIVNPGKLNELGNPVGYKLEPGSNVLPFAHPDASVLKRAAFMGKHVWVTPFSPTEKYAAGDYPNQHKGGNGLPEFTAANRAVENTELVVWYTFGIHHVVRPEDWPVMPVAHIGFMLKPTGFFNRNPGLDVPPPMSHSMGANGTNGATCH